MDARSFRLRIRNGRADAVTMAAIFVVDNHVTDEEAQPFAAMNLDWLEIRQGSVRTYPNGAVAAHVIGNVDGLGRGVAGVELKLNKDLAGTPGAMRVERDGKAESPINPRSSKRP